MGGAWIYLKEVACVHTSAFSNSLSKKVLLQCRTVLLEHDSPQDTTIQSAGPSTGGQSSSQAIMEEFQRMESSLSTLIKTVSNHVDQLSKRVYGPPVKKRPSESRHIHLAYWFDHGQDIILNWTDEEGKGNGK